MIEINCFPIDFYILRARDVSLVDCAVIPVELRKAGLTILFKKVVRRDVNESRNDLAVFRNIC